MIMALSPAQTQRLVALAIAAEKAPHGGKESLYQQACAELSMARATLLRHLKTVSAKAPRKQRSDRGDIELSLEDAHMISAYLMEGYRKNNRKIVSLTEAVSILRANNAIIAGRINPDNGKIIPLSDSTIHRGLRMYSLHPEQLRQATPSLSLRSLHPNHVWQVDASVCVIYYLPDGGAAVVELDQAEHYKNKPENMKAIERFRVIRYVVADHTSGVVRYRYYPHAESGEHTVRFLAWAMAKRGTNDPFHGAPFIVMVDPGATSGGLVRRFCARLGIELIVNKRHNARAKGSVEKGNHLVETTFEQTLRFMKDTRPTSFDELNVLAERYQLWWNSTAIHSRTKKSRFAVWLTITAEQLRITPSSEVLLSLATQEPIERKVNGDLTINYKNRVWDVRAVPNVFIGDTVLVHWHPFIADTAMAVIIGSDGHEQHIALAEIKVNEYGFKENGAIIGQEQHAMPDTVVDTNRKLVHQLAAGTDTLQATEKKREGKGYVPFDGRINPMKEADEYQMPSFIAKRGTELSVNVPNVELLRMSIVDIAKWICGRLGEDWQPSMTALLKQRFPNGATEPELEQVLEQLKTGKPTGKPQLSVVGG